MSIELRWHASLPVLVMTLEGVLSREEYRAMCEERAALLDAVPRPVILLVDARAMEGFPEARDLDLCESIFTDPRVAHTIVVLAPKLYQLIARSVIQAPGREVISFQPTLDAALQRAAELSAPRR